MNKCIMYLLCGASIVKKFQVIEAHDQIISNAILYQLKKPDIPAISGDLGVRRECPDGDGRRESLEHPAVPRRDERPGLPSNCLLDS